MSIALFAQAVEEHCAFSLRNIDIKIFLYLCLFQELRNYFSRKVVTLRLINFVKEKLHVIDSLYIYIYI